MILPLYERMIGNLSYTATEAGEINMANSNSKFNRALA